MFLLKCSTITLTIFIISIHGTNSIIGHKTKSRDIFNIQKKQPHSTKTKINYDFSPQTECGRCEINLSGLYCMCQSGDFDVIEQMTNISRTLDLTSQPKEFMSFTLYDGVISEFADNSFIDMKFDSLVIENPINLQRIHTNAFNSTALYTNDRFMVWGDINKNFSLRNEPPNYDLWAAISSLVNVQTLEITLGRNMVHEIPANAFRQINGPQNNLTDIHFVNGYTISRIGEYAFSQLTNLSDGSIDISYITIQHISPHAFDFNYTSDRIVNVILTNCELTEDSFDAGSFIGRNRPIWLYLSHNKIQYIREEVFYDFFDGDHRSLVFFDDNPLNCSDTQPFEWLLLSPIRNEYMARIVYPYCDNGTEIWHLNVGTPDDTADGTNEILFSIKVMFANLLFVFVIRYIH